MQQPLSVALLLTLHVMCGVVLFGLSIANYFYVINSLKNKTPLLTLYALKLSYYSDVLFIPLILTQVITALLLMMFKHIAMSTPWTVVAFIAFAVVVGLWIVVVVLKTQLIKGMPQVLKPRWFVISFSLAYGLMFLIFALIIHDAVLQQTVFAPLVRRLLA